MCCFSRPVRSVSKTNIFARASHDRQYLVYSMAVNTVEPVAMILPIPVKHPAKENAVRFHNLENYPEFFTDMLRGFPMPVAAAAGMRSKSAAKEAPLKVEQVGSYEASFVPALKDFARLDARFRLPANAWNALPQYKDWSFAVFKLKPGTQIIHPMAFDFPRAEPTRLFFPTVHIHDGKVHATAMFDHALYCQKTPTDTFSLVPWAESHQHASGFMDVSKTQQIVLGTTHCYRMRMDGRKRNADVWL
jgi:hypothetical protein